MDQFLGFDEYLEDDIKSFDDLVIGDYIYHKKSGAKSIILNISKDKIYIENFGWCSLNSLSDYFFLDLDINVGDIVECIFNGNIIYDKYLRANLTIGGMYEIVYISYYDSCTLCFVMGDENVLAEYCISRFKKVK